MEVMLANLRQGAVVGGLGGAVAGLIYGALAIGPAIGTSAALGALGGLVAGAVWLAIRRLDLTAVVD
ncbi:MAG: hypothetical protein JNK64_29115 [Myxococcales bacterium]|nr:hypothetical protein [Myxococcales bacterium]